VYVAAELGLADLLAERPQTADQLATATRAHPAALKRLLKALVALELLEQNGDLFQLTPVGQELRDGRLRGAARFFGGHPVWGTWGGLKHSIMTGERAFDHVHGMRSWEYYKSHPEAAQRFDAAMHALTGGIATGIVTSYDFSRFPVVVDVGGGDGTLLAEIVRANPGVRGILFDRPDVIERAGQPELEKIGGDFLQKVPPGGDAYVMKSIIHDWADAEAIVILQRCREAMRDGACLLLVERVLPEVIGPADLEALLGDLNMLTGPGGLERTEAEFAELLRESGFRLEKVVPTGTVMSVLEAAPAT
jgi:O-methyltransferase/methyltransferase family protein